MIFNIKFQILIHFFVAFVHCENVIFSQCTERKATATNVQVEISNCNLTAACTLSRGQNEELILKFTPLKDSSAEFERLIIAQIQSRSLLLDIPYGESIDIVNSTFFEEDNKPFFYPIKKNIPLVHKFIFPIVKDAPKASLIIRYIIREKIDLIRSSRNWQSHPGQLFVCVEIPIEIV